MRLPLHPDEHARARVSVYWTGTPAAMPSRLTTLHVTSQRLVITASRVHPFVLLALWPPLGIIGVIAAGLPGVAVAAGLLVLAALLLPRRIVTTLQLTEVTGCTVVSSEGWRRFTTRDVVQIVTSRGLYRLSPTGRNETSARSIIEALENAGLRVEPQPVLIGPHQPGM